MRYIIQRLRRSSADERKALAMQLAAAGTDEAIAELIRMVEGKQRYGLFWVHRCDYGYADQLIGIEALGESASPKALEYLNELNTRQNVTDSYVTVGGSSTKYLVEVYPKAKGELTKRLRRIIGGTRFTSERESPILEERTDIIEEEPVNIAHVLLNQAITKLQSSISSSPK